LFDATGTHGLVCKQAPSRVVRHRALNGCISRAFGAAGIPVQKEQAGLVQKAGKRHNGCTVSLGVLLDLWLGTSHCAPPWPIGRPTRQPPIKKPELLPNKLQTKNLLNMLSMITVSVCNTQVIKLIWRDLHL